jgi:hypothetical protein
MAELLSKYLPIRNQLGPERVRQVMEAASADDDRVPVFLRKIGCEEHAETFAREGITYSMLPRLSEEYLEAELHVSIKSQRTHILEAAASLKADQRDEL